MALDYGYKMKRFALILSLVLLLAGSLMAQSDPHGETDTLFLDQVTARTGREFIIDVNLWNDESLGGITVPLIYPTEKLEFLELTFTGGRIEYVGSKHSSVDEETGKILVGAAVFDEAYIPTGEGKLFSIRFRLMEGAVPGEVIVIDSTFIEPVAEILLSDSSGADIYPVFRAGRVTVSSENEPPYFTPVPELYVAEGESLYIEIEVVDPDGDEIDIANPIHPYNSVFIDNGDGTALFAWRPDYIGPLSSDLSPFSFVFWASDGQGSSHMRVKVNVINVNRAPEISAPAFIQAEAGDSLGINVAALDPDFETIEWDISGLPPGATFDWENPGFINWVTDFADSGNYRITLIAADPYGLADTAEIEIELLPVTFFSLRIDTLTTFSGRVVGLDVFLRNRLDIKEFNILITLDPAILTALGVSREGSRISHFDYFNYHINDNNNQGDLRIIGRAGEADPLGDGEGFLFRITIQVSSNLTYVGSQVPVRFITRVFGDNTLTLTGGQVAFGEEINFFDGHILIATLGITLLGDINLNGIAYEISDAVYFSNYFVNPSLYPLNDQQVVNSDINRDGFAPSVADLVLLVKVISGGAEPPQGKRLTENPTVRVELVRDETGLYLQTDASVDLGGACFRFSGLDINRAAVTNLTDMDMISNVRGAALRCLLMSYEQKVISSGTVSLLKLSDYPDLRITIDEADIADADGRVVEIYKAESPVLPTGFTLYQNSPNPFNPTTHILFDLGAPSQVTLSVYNILGQEVIRLADGEYPAGRNSVVWHGVDSNGLPVASGIYLYRLKTDRHSASRKMLLLK